MVNILVLSVGSRNKVVQYFKRALTDKSGKRLGNVVATDLSSLAPALYEADRFYLVPAVTEAGYMDAIFNICKEEKISAALSLIDPELGLIAKHGDEFRELGVTVIGSSHELCELSLDKMQMYRWLTAHGYKTARSYADREGFYADVAAGKAAWPAFVKPVRGSASMAASKVGDKETVDLLFRRQGNLMVQEYLNGQEIGADVYIDMLSGEAVSIFTRKKIAMRAGETDKAVSFLDGKLFALIEKFVAEAGYRGQIDIDIFQVNGEYYISEVNPRFGGGYPHAYECGCDYMKLITNNLRGIANEKRIGNYEAGVYMMKYNEVVVESL